MPKLLLKRWIERFVHVLRQHALLLSVCLGVIVWSVILWTLFAPQTIAYNFSSTQPCRISPRLFPNISAIEVRQPFQITRPASVSIGTFTVYSHRLCAVAQAAPKAQTDYSYKERLFNRSFLGHSVRVSTKKYPVLSSKLTARKSIPLDGIVSMTLNQPDTTFTYALKVGNLSTPCLVKHITIVCQLGQLQLSYAQKYDLSLMRQFNNQAVAAVSTVPIETITPTTITATSIVAKLVAQDKPTDIVIQTDKDLVSVGMVILVAKNSDNTETIIPTTTTVSGKQIKVAFSKELVRRTAFELRLSSLTATDGSGLVGASFMLPFSTSGGPKVTAANIGTRNVSPSPSVAITFDQTLLANQDLAPVVTLLVQGQPQPAALSISGNKIIVVPSQTLPLCAPFTIKISNAVQNQFGINGDSTWSINSRAICYTTFSIGTSVKGRALTAYRFGSGANPIIYMGAMHGDEANSRTLMNEWFNDLSANPDRNLARSIVVIPSVNPDGVASSNRLNAHNIDLNRNFPANDWKSVVTSPDSPQPTPAGGPNPLSEPESQAVASYIRQVQPRLVMSFHSSAAIVEANEAGDSVSIASSYALKARYRAVPKSQSASVFQYDTTGAMEDWMRDSLGSPAIVVELLSSTSSEFSRNRDALWYTTGL